MRASHPTKSRAATRDPDSEPVWVRAYGGHISKHRTSMIDACRRDPRLAEKVREILGADGV